jgi:hypothetical protein
MSAVPIVIGAEGLLVASGQAASAALGAPSLVLAGAAPLVKR